MKRTKQAAFLLTFCILLTTLMTGSISAAKVGDNIDDVKYETDAKFYINGYRVPLYVVYIGDKYDITVLVGDLRNYGFDTVHDAKARTTTITRNYGKKFTPLTVTSSDPKKLGTKHQYIGKPPANTTILTIPLDRVKSKYVPIAEVQEHVYVKPVTEPAIGKVVPLKNVGIVSVPAAGRYAKCVRGKVSIDENKHFLRCFKLVILIPF